MSYRRRKISLLSYFHSVPCSTAKTVPHQDALERGPRVPDHDEGEEAKYVNEAAAQAGDVGLVEEGADQVAEGQDAQTIITEVEEKDKAVAFGQHVAVLQHQCEDDDGDKEVGGAFQEPGKEVAQWVDSHHFHVL